jgi:Two component regulator propeller
MGFVVGPVEPSFDLAHTQFRGAAPGGKEFNSDDGLPQNSVTSIAQTADGYLWLGTFGGLARFDGQHFRVFRSTATDGPSSDRILALVEDAHAHMPPATSARVFSAYAVK